ncbi:hypothetical protein [Micromonospora sp. WMMD1082]|uniref:hypothetical protein n=1 Tax=Micromonospora sp. WMMD1082 TaxID=3016104 RepID=UPI002415C633|nr:hypothetical protein [Micromonospora sp. WMMD1082]MDG4795128.1 hypothetical protein [Micromonospora sp. WMMD1082]
MGYNGFHPELPPTAHCGHRHDCNPRPGRYPTEAFLQLIQYVGPPQTTFIRLELGGVDERRAHDAHPSQAKAICDALTAIVTRADALMPPASRL